MREIVTIQVGGFANYVGSHFWNFQDELLGLADDPQSDPVFKNQLLNMNVLYRTGETQQRVSTYTPRLLSVDFQGSLGSMSSRGTLYNEGSSQQSDVITWTGNVSTETSEPRKKNLFLQSLQEEEHDRVSSGKESTQREIQDKDIVECLDKEVEYWTDFSKVHYHPQSLYELNGIHNGTQEFDNYGIGKDVFSEGLRGEEICDRLRFFVEECDHIQGFQFIVDDSGGFSALSADFLENIADEYTNIPVLLYSVRGPGPHMTRGSRKQTVSRALHDTISFSRLSSFCKLYVPVGLPILSQSKASQFLCIDDENPYQCSAVYAAALHTNSIPFRMEPQGPFSDAHEISGALNIIELVQMLTGQYRQNSVASLDVAMPAPALNGESVEQSFLRSLKTLTPEATENVEDLQALESMSVLGAFGSEGHQGSVSEVKKAIDTSYEHATSKPMFCHLSISRSPLPIPLPFPSIFSNRVSQKGELLKIPCEGSHRRSSLDVHSIPLAARLRSSNAVLPYLEHKLLDLCKYGIQRGALGTGVVRDWGFGEEELDDMRENLSKMVSSLDSYRQESSDSD